MIRILHLEDDPMKAETIHRFVEHLDFDFHVVTTWKEYQQALVSGTEYDAIVSDLNVPMFPGQTPKNYGRAVVGEMRRRLGTPLPILFISGDPDYDMAERLDVPMYSTLDHEEWSEWLEALV